MSVWDHMDADYDDDDNNVFTDVLRAMMFSFGDAKEPLKESVDIVYKILRKEMNVLLIEAQRVAVRRKRKEISHEEMLFLMKKNKGKLKRLIKYLEVMDDSPGFGKSSALYFCNASFKNENQAPKRKRAEICKDFLASIEDVGEFTSIFEDPTIIDVSHRNMLERRNAMTKWMNLREYKEFTGRILEKSFCAKQMFKNFENWLLEDAVIEMNLTELAFEIVRFLARETVSKIVDLALIMKSKKNRKAKSTEINLKPFNFYRVAKKCNFVELFPAPSIPNRTSRNIDHSYHANNDSKESIVHIHSLRIPTSISGTSEDVSEPKISTKDTDSLVSDENIDGVDESVLSKDSVTSKVLKLNVVPSVIRLKHVGEVDNSHHSATVPKTSEDFDGQKKSNSRIANKDESDSDSIAQQSTDANDDQPMDELNSENEYWVVQDDSDSQIKQCDSNLNDGTDIATTFLQNIVSQNPYEPREKMDNLSIDSISDDEIRERDSNSVHFSNDTTVNTSVQRKTTPVVTPSDSRFSLNDKSETIRKYLQEPSENRSHPQTPITPEEIVQAVAIYHQHSWSNFFHSREKPPKIKLLCIDDHVSVKI